MGISGKQIRSDRVLKARPVLLSTVQYDEALRSGQTRLADVLRVAKRLGVDGVELRDVYWTDQATEIAECRALAAELGLTLSYATFARLFGDEPNGPVAAREAIEVGAALGAPLVRIFPGPVPDDSDALSWAGARELVDLAAQRGLTIALENFAGSPGSRLDEVEHVLRQINSPSLGTNVDIGNYTANGQDVPVAIRALADRVVYAHLKHMRTTATGSEATYLGGGDLPLTETMAAFDRLPRAVTYCFEFAGGGDPEGRIVKSLEFLRGG
jgi:sugar phosphate isomerase/epimerase